MKTSIIVPVKDEQDNIEPLIQDLIGVFDDFEIIFIDGQSTDQTRNNIKMCKRRYSPIAISLVLQEEGRKGQAVWIGTSAAKGDVILIYDGDLTISGSDAGHLAKAALRSDSLCIADRLAQKKMVMPWPNYLFNVAMSWLFWIVFGTRCNDLFAGCKAFPASHKNSLYKYRNHFSTRDEWSDLQMLSAAVLLRINIVSIPVNYCDRLTGVSKILRIRDGFNLLMFLLEAFLSRSVKRTTKNLT